MLKWLESYLTGRHQSVIISGATDPDQKRSDKARLAQGVPQGSVLGPILFTLYITPLGDICRKHGVIFHSYADDQQNYLSFSPANTVSRSLCLQPMENCIKDIWTWMHVNLLKLNGSKTEVLLLGTRQTTRYSRHNQGQDRWRQNLLQHHMPGIWVFSLIVIWNGQFT